MVKKILVALVVALMLGFGFANQSVAEIKLIDRPEDERNASASIDCLVNFCAMAMKKVSLKLFYDFSKDKKKYSWEKFQEVNNVQGDKFTTVHTWYELGPR